MAFAQGVGRLDLALVYDHSNHESYNQTKNTNDTLTVRLHSTIGRAVKVPRD
jgi:hypothetical protein